MSMKLAVYDTDWLTYGPLHVPIEAWTFIIRNPDGTPVGHGKESYSLEERVFAASSETDIHWFPAKHVIENGNHFYDLKEPL